MAVHQEGDRTMSDRLLSEQEMKDVLPSGFNPEPCDKEMCKAQDLKSISSNNWRLIK